MIGNNTYGGGGGKQKGIYPIDSSGLPTGDVIVPDGVTSLNPNIFYNNKNITSVKLPTTCVKFDGSCFSGCTKLKSVNIPDGMPSIPSNCFYNTAALSTVYIPASVTSIGDSAFNYSGVSNITLAEGTKMSLGSSCFSRTSVTNEDVTNILNHAGSLSSYVFDYTTTITEIVIPKCWFGMFGNCTNLKKVTLTGATKSSSETLYHFGRNAFQNCTALEEFIFDIPEDKQQVQKIAYGAFNSCTKLSSFTIPNTVQEIGDYAFSGCTSLTTLNIPSSVTKIDIYAFRQSGALSNLTIDDNAFYSLGGYCFSDNKNITSGELVKKILTHATTLGTNIFQSCSSLPAELEVPKISTGTFYSCTSLVKVNVTGYLDTLSMGNEVFKGCSKLEEVTLAEGVTTIGVQVFYDCKVLKKVYLPSSITTATNSSLTSTNNSYYVFYNCTALEDVQVGTDWNMSLRLNVSSNLTVESMVAMFNNLKNLTDETAKTLTLGSTNLAKLTDEQKAIATNKNWTLA